MVTREMVISIEMQNLGESILTAKIVTPTEQNMDTNEFDVQCE